MKNILFLFLILFINSFLFTRNKINDHPHSIKIVNAEIAVEKADLSGIWIGEGDDSNYPYTHYKIKANFKQTSDSVLTGYIIWKDNWGGHATEYITGKVSAVDGISWHGTKMKKVSNKHEGIIYIIANYTATLSEDGDKIIGSWIPNIPGTFTMTKKK